MKSIFYLTLFFSGLLVLWSCNEDLYIDPVQYTSVRGRVLYNATQQPARNAQVTLSPTSRLVNTDSSGAFRFDSVQVGSYTLQAAKSGYVTQVATVSATADAAPLVTILLNDDKSQNRPPTVPTLVAPALSSTVQSTTVTLKWKSSDINRDSLTYNVLLYKSGSTSPTLSYTGIKVDTLVTSALEYSTSYLWQVIVTDGVNTVNGPVWSFSTGAYPEYSYLFTKRIGNQYQIFASNATGDMAQLTREGSNWRPIASPNRRQIAYISNSTTEMQLFVMNSDGSNKIKVTSVPIAGLYQTDLSFSWSPDGTQLLYPSNDRLLAIRTDGTGLRVVSQAATGRIFAGCDWGPGNRIAARTTGTNIYDNEITVFQADGLNPKSVFVRKGYRVGNPVFSVDGRQLLFSADSSGFMNEQGRQLDARILLLDLATSGITDLSTYRLTSGSTGQSNKPAGTNDLEPRFSPNGAQIIFTNVSNDAINTGAVGSVYFADIDRISQGTNRKLLFSSAEMPYWRQ